MNSRPDLSSPSSGSSPVRLTQTVKKGGCAAKVAATELRKILASVDFPPAPVELTIDGRHFDDAAVYKISDSVSMVQTIDFFTPILDSPFDFGRVAAANAVSDVYAMGGKPVTALAVLAFPVADLPSEIIAEVLRGACDVLKKAKCALAGGHSIDDETLKFGLSVSGLVKPSQIWANTGAKVGDVLILTKALGTGTLTAALKRDALTENEIRPAIESMAQLNNAIEYLDQNAVNAIHAATDVTGFGLSGHSMQMAKASGVQFVFESQLIPRLPRAEECLSREFLTKAHRTNREYTEAAVTIGKNVTSIDQLIFHDPQTSGGLLLSVAPETAEHVIELLRPHFANTTKIGHVCASPNNTSGTLELR